MQPQTSTPRLTSPKHPAAPAQAGPRGWTPPADGHRQRLLYFTKTVGYEHSAVARQDAALSFSEQVLIEMGRRAGFDVECSKDGRIFDAALDEFDGLVFYTLGDLTRDEKSSTPAMSQTGKTRLLERIAQGMPFVGFHAATDTFYGDGLDPYIEMIGGEFCGHGLQQDGTLQLASPDFPGLQGMPASLRLFEEWYLFKKMSSRMHVIHVLDTRSMKGNLYNRPPLPATWARLYGDGRVFYTSLGHREDVWACPEFQQIAYAGLAWALGNVEADICSNFALVTPGGNTYRRLPVETGCVSR